MKSSFFTPITPAGKSTITPAPPWHYSGDFLIIEFWADPKAVADLLPDDLDPDPKADGHCLAYFVDWQFSGDHEEYLEPQRYQYREFFVLVDALFKEKPVSFCPYIFVDNDAALARGWAQGFPKRLGTVAQTRAFAAPSIAAAKPGPGSKFAGTAAACGQRIAKGIVTLEEPLTDANVLGSRPTINLRHFPRLAAGKHDKPAVHELVESVMDNLTVADAWVGKGALVLPVCDGEEISELAPNRVGAGYRMSISYSVTDLKTLADHSFPSE